MHCGRTVSVITSLCLLAGICIGASVKNPSKVLKQGKLTEQLDGNGQYVLSWTINEQTREIEFEVEAATLGYVGLGLSPKGSMVGADIFIGGLDTRGDLTTYYGDYHATSNGAPILDTDQNWKLLEARENLTHTYLRVSRLLDTCDDDDYPVTEENTARVIWSLGATDDINYHGTRRGTKSINLITVPEPEVDLDKLMKLNMIVNTTMPSQDTTYWCTMHRGPAVSKRHHVVGFGALLTTPAALKHTHHFIVNKCTAPSGGNATELFAPWVGHQGGSCFAGTFGRLSQSYCQKYLFVWAVGGKRTLFPLVAGYPVDESEANLYYMLEVHYDNPDRLSGVQFETGVEIYYTDELRPREAVLIEVGHRTLQSILIPPRQTDFVISGHCAPFCTRKLPSGGIRVFNLLLHSHISGRKLKLRHFRGKEELKWAAFDDNYDFDFQQNKPLREDVIIQPGDHLTLECSYDSMWNNGYIVAGGTSSREEMCLAFLWAYTDSDERINIDECMSAYSMAQTMRDFGITNYTRVVTASGPDTLIYAPPEMAGMWLAEALSTQIQWTPALVEDQQQKHRFGVQDSRCCDPTTNRCESGIIMYPDATLYTPEPTC